MKLTHFILLLLIFGLSSCVIDFSEEEENDPTKDMLFSEVDGGEYKDALQHDGARAVSAMILLGHADKISPQMVAMVADSLNDPDSLWRNRHYEAISLYYEQYDDIPKSLYFKFSSAIFSMLMYHPNEVINQFDEATVLELDFWNNRLTEEIHYHNSKDSIPIGNMIAMAQDHCSDCDSTQLATIEKMVETLYFDL